MLRKEDVGPRVLTVVLQLAHDDEHEDGRMTAVSVVVGLVHTRDGYCACTHTRGW